MGKLQILKPTGTLLAVKLANRGRHPASRAVFWSDGKTEHDGQPENGWLLKVPNDGCLFWLDECEEAFEVPLHDAGNPRWRDLSYAEEPTEDDLFAALSKPLDIKRLQYVRLRLWWYGNDPIRLDRSKALPQKHEHNLREFIASLSTEAEPERMIMAEAYRQLGEFGSAVGLLEHGFSKCYQKTAYQIREQCGKKDRKVARLG